MIMGGLLGAAFFAKFFSVLALGPVLVALGAIFNNSHFVDWGNAFQTDQWWILGASLFMVVLQTFILISGTKATFRWQNYSFLIAMAGTLVAFIVLLVGSRRISSRISIRSTRALAVATSPPSSPERRARHRRRPTSGTARDIPDALLDPGFHDVELLVRVHVR